MAELADITERVERALEGLRPYLEADGGNISLVEVTEDHHVKVELHGACADCQMIHMTMKGGVEQAIRQAAPEVVKVEAINWAEV
ncbi:MAG: NifU family protein [Crocinitomicaceae bacterium TMED209]|jgi:Fe-S cluster biogenesis protein NfuA|nr:MAG: NifU family protein [Crocinitomicaceae bacterium TMED209]|tara:strand:+ start:345 stop:599 length:255 start_codon:yes stop_codon:yes gene_type:complete